MRRYTTLWNIISEKQQQPEMCTVINNKSQRSEATWFRNGGIFYQYFVKKFTAESALKKFKSVDIWQSYR